MTKFFIGADEWNGLSKLIEEAGEVLQLGGKLLGSDGDTNHFDGSDLGDRLEEEIGDLLAAIEFFVVTNPRLSRANIEDRRYGKLKQFYQWSDPK